MGVVMLKEGMIVRGPFWSEPIEIKKIETLGTNIHLIGAKIYSNVLIESLLDENEMDKISHEEVSLDFSASPVEFLLALEAQRFKNASIFDPFLAMSTSTIDPLPFQLDAVYLHALKQPRMRFMIADDPGAGKTIMAGLIIKELKLRGLAKRILVVSPGHLKTQWEREMREKFQESFQIVDRAFINSHDSENPWEVKNQFITSIDFAKRDDIKNMLNGTDWDLVIVDEAHKMSAYSWGDTIHRTKAYRLGEVLSKTTEHMLFLTATPHKGDPENYRLLLDLLIPGFFSDPSMIIESKREGDNPLFIRRIKEDLKNFKGEPIFTKRFTKTIDFKLSDKEMDLYYKLSKYVREGYNKAINDDKKHSFVFALLLLQRRLASSTYALYNSLLRKKDKLETYLDHPDSLREIKIVQMRDQEDSEESKIWKQEEELEGYTLSINMYELEKELKTIKCLLGKAESILEFENETKLAKLKELLDSLGDEKVLIFSEAKDTVDYLLKKIFSWGYSVNTIQGGMKMQERVKAERVFEKETQVMVATEAAGEGINLQFCHLMINYDIPWNPNRLEQRMGRIHRYKQKKDVHIFNFVACNTREGKVLQTILNKLEEIKNSIGSDKVFDVIGDVFQGRDLYNLIAEAISGEREVTDIRRELNFEVDEEYKERLRRELFEQGLVDSINYEQIYDMSEKTDEIKLMSDYLREFFIKTYNILGGRYTIRQDSLISVQSIPRDLRKITKQENFKRTYGLINDPGFLITFDKEAVSENENLEYITFGHPLLESLIKWVEKEFSSTLRIGSSFIDPQGIYSGVIWFFEANVKDGANMDVGKKIIAVNEAEGILNNVNPAVLWDLIPEMDFNSSDNPIGPRSAQIQVIDSVKGYMKELKEERDRQANVKEKYGVKSIQQNINQLTKEIKELEFRKVVGEKVELPLYNKKEKRKDYQIALNELETEIMKEKSLSLSMPKLIGAIQVRSENKSLKLIEKEKIFGNLLIMEKNEGRNPKILNEDYIGFDIKSVSEDEKRYITIKSIENNEILILSFNQMIKASHFGDNYWLYIVIESNNKIYHIQNPVNTFNIQKKSKDITISPEQWKKEKFLFKQEDF